MKILICTNSLGARGGIERVTIVKANALASIKGVDVAICYTDKGTYPYDTICPISPLVKVIDTGVTFWDLYPLSIKKLFYEATIKFIRLRKTISNIIADYKPDVVVSTGSYEKYALASILPSHITGHPVIKIREYHFGSDYRKYITQTLIAHLAGIFEDKVLSRFFDMNFLLTKEDLDMNHKNRQRFSYRHNPLCIEYINFQRRTNTVIAVGRLTDQKNHISLLRIWASIADKAGDWELWIAGEGELRSELGNAAAKLGIAKSVKFLGFRKDIAQILSSCKILALTSKYEGFGLCITEAMACGTVPISFRTPYGPADIINHNQDGILVDYMNEEQFADNLISLIHNPDRIADMSQRAIIRAQDFDADRISASWIETYQNLLGEKNPI